MADVELRHLRTMAAIAEEGTFGRAAGRLRYTQSSVSQQIAALEKAVGGAVFDRPGGPRPVRIAWNLHDLGHPISMPSHEVSTGQQRRAPAKADRRRKPRHYA